MICTHSLRLGNLCTQCGETVKDEPDNLFCLLHENDVLKTTKAEAKRIAKEKKKKLDGDKKLVLIIDLDQTILHASCNKEIEMVDFEEIKVTKKGKKTKKVKIEVKDITELRINGSQTSGLSNHEETSMLKNNVEVEVNNKSKNEESKNYAIPEINKTIEQTEKIIGIETNTKSFENKDSYLESEEDENKRRKIDTTIQDNQITNQDSEDEELEITENNVGLFKLYTFEIGRIKHYIKLRPCLKELLDFCFSRYEMHVYTMGNREYAEHIVSIIDPDSKYFENRIITRDENEKMLIKNLDRLSSDHSNIVILDDRGDVWNFPVNLINIKPYFFFKSGDINAPENIQKGIKEEINTDKEINDLFWGVEDLHLRGIEILLGKLHNLYFEDEISIKQAFKRIRECIFSGRTFYIDRKIRFPRHFIRKIVKLCNGKCEKKNIALIVAADLNASILEKQCIYKVDIVAFQWIMDCYSSHLCLDHDIYILKKYNDDEFVNELEKMLE